MHLVERHRIRKDDPRMAVIDAAACASKNLSTQANDHIRQVFIHEGSSLPSADIFHRWKQHDAYRVLPRKVRNSILIQRHTHGLSFCETSSRLSRRSVFLSRLPTEKAKEKGCTIHTGSEKTRLSANRDTGSLRLTHRDGHTHHGWGEDGPGADGSST